MDRFSVYKREFELPDGTIARRQFIVVKHDDGTLTFTNFGKYIKSNRTIQTPSNDGGNRFYFVTLFLNYAFKKYHLSKLNQLTVDIAQDFLNKYAQGQIENTKHTKETINMCVDSIFAFLVNLADSKKVGFSSKDLYKKQIYKNKNNQIQERKISVFEILSDPRENVILRDIPNKAFSLFLHYIMEKHTDLLGLVILQSFAGLRPAEACNVRREDSPLGPGLMFSITDGKTTKIEIDLRKEINLRSDNVRVGNIKKERVAKVPIAFLDVFNKAYKTYMDYMENKPCEEDFKAFTVNRSGKAMTYDAYYKTFHQIVKEEFAPLCLESIDSEVVEFGLALMENNLSPHAFRHWYSVQLTLSGYSATELMHARGDKSIESALTYVQNKGELEKTYAKVTKEMFDYFNWAGAKQHANKNTY